LINLLTTAWNTLVSKDGLRTRLVKELFGTSCFLIGESARHLVVLVFLLTVLALVIFLLLFAIFLLILLLLHVLCFFLLGIGNLLSVFLHWWVILECDCQLGIRSERCRM